MGDGNSLPRPEKRKGFSARDVAAVFIKYEARCAKCREKVSLGEYAIDHIQAIDHLGAHSLENWQLLCKPCHATKTSNDVKASAKGRRLRGEVGNGRKQPIRSRGFNKKLSKGFDGKVRVRT
jgi:5-methylcytosine-specific restriction protein A